MPFPSEPSRIRIQSSDFTMKFISEICPVFHSLNWSFFAFGVFLLRVTCYVLQCKSEPFRWIKQELWTFSDYLYIAQDFGIIFSSCSPLPIYFLESLNNKKFAFSSSALIISVLSSSIFWESYRYPIKCGRQKQNIFAQKVLDLHMTWAEYHLSCPEHQNHISELICLHTPDQLSSPASVTFCLHTWMPCRWGRITYPNHQCSWELLVLSYSFP